MAHLDIWALRQMQKDLAENRIADSFSREPSESYVFPRRVGDGYELPIDAGDTQLKEYVNILSEYLEGWELGDARKFAPPIHSGKAA